MDTSGVYSVCGEYQKPCSPYAITIDAVHMLINSRNDIVDNKNLYNPIDSTSKI